METNQASLLNLLKKMLLRLGLISLMAVCSCSAASKSQNVPTGSPTPSQQTKQNDALQKQIEQIASAAKGRVGVAAEVLETGE
jgi:TRAP-type C4-dicarboxylate transport system substrate-binding protein